MNFLKTTSLGLILFLTTTPHTSLFAATAAEGGNGDDHRSSPVTKSPSFRALNHKTCQRLLGLLSADFEGRASQLIGFLHQQDPEHVEESMVESATKFKSLKTAFRLRGGLQQVLKVLDIKVGEDEDCQLTPDQFKGMRQEMVQEASSSPSIQIGKLLTLLDGQSLVDATLQTHFKKFLEIETTLSNPSALGTSLPTALALLDITAEEAKGQVAATKFAEVQREMDLKFSRKPIDEKTEGFVRLLQKKRIITPAEAGKMLEILAWQKAFLSHTLDENLAFLSVQKGNKDDKESRPGFLAPASYAGLEKWMLRQPVGTLSSTLSELHQTLTTEKVLQGEMKDRLNLFVPFQQALTKGTGSAALKAALSNLGFTVEEVAPKPATPSSGSKRPFTAGAYPFK